MSLLGDVLAWFLFFSLGALGIAVTGLGTLRTSRALTAPQTARPVGVLLSTPTGLGLCAGGWIGLSIWWSVRWLRRTATEPSGK